MGRILVAGFQHETNTFAPVLASYDDFVRGEGWPGLTRGAACFETFDGMNIPITGFLPEAKRLGHEVVPLLWCATVPCGYVTEDAFERVADEIVALVRDAGRFDAIYLDLHGAMVAEHREDGEGELLMRLRHVVGPKLPIVVSLDLHANTTRQMAEHASTLIAYRTYPHVDMAETGMRAARHLDRLLKSGKPESKAFRKLPFLLPLTAQCTLVEPSQGVYRAVADLEKGRVSSVSFTPGFPQADISECGPALMAYADDPEAAERAAESLFGHIMAREREFKDELLAPDVAVARAMTTRAERPIVIADAQDNPGAGGTSDTTGLLRAMAEARCPDALLGLIFDPEAALIAHKAGKGAEANLSVGGKAFKGDPPFAAPFKVEGLSDGRFLCTGPFYGGNRVNLGPTALVRLGGVRAIVTSKRMQAADQEQFRHIGAEPRTAKVLGLKSSVHFRADFQPIAHEVLVTAARGAAPMDPRTLPYKRLRKGVRLAPMAAEHGR